jgi:hypothetical protein
MTDHQKPKNGKFMPDDFSVIYKLKLFVLSRVGNFKLLVFLESLYHLTCLPFGYVSYILHRLMNRPYFGIWLASAQGHPGRFKYMTQCIDSLVDNGEPKLAKDLRILEIGAYAGGSAIVWGQALKKYGIANGKVISIDPWDSYPAISGGGRRLHFRIMNHNLGNGNVLRLFVRNLKAAGVSDVCYQFRGRSEDILPLLDGQKFDVIYIDGNHHVNAISKDLEGSLPLLADGGMICGPALEIQLEDLDIEYVKKNFDNELTTDPVTGHIFHPGVTFAVGKLFGRRISHYGGFWVVRKKGALFEDVILD